MAAFCILVGLVCLRVDRPYVSDGISVQPWQASLVGIAASALGIKHFIQATARYLRNRHGYARVIAGLCARCGYDLRGNATERCPECGEVVKPLHARNAQDESSARWFDG